MGDSEEAAPNQRGGGLFTGGSGIQQRLPKKKKEVLTLHTKKKERRSKRRQEGDFGVRGGVNLGAARKQYFKGKNKIEERGKTKKWNPKKRKPSTGGHEAPGDKRRRRGDRRNWQESPNIERGEKKMAKCSEKYPKKKNRLGGKIKLGFEAP